LPRIPFQLDKEHFMSALRNRFEKAVIVCGVSEGEIKNSH